MGLWRSLGPWPAPPPPPSFPRWASAVGGRWAARLAGPGEPGQRQICPTYPKQTGGPDDGDCHSKFAWDQQTDSPYGTDTESNSGSSSSGVEIIQSCAPAVAATSSRAQFTVGASGEPRTRKRKWTKVPARGGGQRPDCQRPKRVVLVGLPGTSKRRGGKRKRRWEASCAMVGAPIGMFPTWRADWHVPSSFCCDASPCWFHAFFPMAKDWRLQSAVVVRLSSLGEWKEQVWDSLLHVSTSPVPSLMRTDPDLVAKGLGTLGAYQNPNDLWGRVVPPNVVRLA